MNPDSAYFEIKDAKRIETLDQFLSLNKKQSYASSQVRLDDPIRLMAVRPDLLNQHNTCGIFRGQSEDWPLIPAVYRNVKIKPKDELLDIHIRHDIFRSHYYYEKFCQHAEAQNYSFPINEIDRMCIAQHYGIETSLLDWTKNIFVAAYFALDLTIEPKSFEEVNLEPYIYHIEDERWLKNDLINEKDIFSINYSALYAPKPIDRRMERQFSVFSFHPHLNMIKEKIPVTKYQLSGNLYMELWKIMEGMGFSSFHFFPDYKGIADHLKTHML